MTPDVEPGYLRDQLPKEAPYSGETWEEIFKDFETKIMPGVTHWQHSKFHAYFPAGNSYPSIMGEMISAGLGNVGFSWAASPSCTELETIVLDWLGKMINLPKVFLPFAEEQQQLQNGTNGHTNGSSPSSKDLSEDEDVPSDCIGGGVILVSLIYKILN